MLDSPPVLTQSIAMRLNQPLLKLPKTFCAETLAAEVRALPASAWVPHPGKLPGNDAVPLVTPEGSTTNAFFGQMAATEHLRNSPYIMAVMAEIGAVWGRSRLMGLAPSADVPAHVDVHYHWRTHMRIHIPVITSPAVRFTVGDDSAHMGPGECWVFDSFRMHNVHNGGADKRVHLVLDTVGGEELWDLVARAERGEQASGAPLPPGAHPNPVLRFEHARPPKTMSPWEVGSHIAYIREHMAPGPRVAAAFERLDRFLAGWTALWGEYGEAETAVPAYRQLIAALRQDLVASGGAGLPLTNEVPLMRALDELVFQVALPAAPAIPQAQRLAS